MKVTDKVKTPTFADAGVQLKNQFNRGLYMKDTILQQGASQIKSLIQISEVSINNEVTQTVNARKLHAFLEVETRFNDWIKRRIEEYGFIEGTDFTLLKNEYRKKINNLATGLHPLTTSFPSTWPKSFPWLSAMPEVKKHVSILLIVRRKQKLFINCPVLPDFRNTAKQKP